VAKNIAKIARRLGATYVERLPETGGGAFGAARLAALVRDRLVPSDGVRPGRPTNPNWVKRPKIPMSNVTLKGLEELSKRLSTAKRRVSPMQLAAHLLETSVAQLTQGANL
jgi:hypothetical protein